MRYSASAQVWGGEGKRVAPSEALCHEDRQHFVAETFRLSQPVPGVLPRGGGPQLEEAMEKLARNVP